MWWAWLPELQGLRGSWGTGILLAARWGVERRSEGRCASPCPASCIELQQQSHRHRTTLHSTENLLLTCSIHYLLRFGWCCYSYARTEGVTVRCQLYSGICSRGLPYIANNKGSACVPPCPGIPASVRSKKSITISTTRALKWFY